MLVSEKKKLFKFLVGFPPRRFCSFVPAYFSLLPHQFALSINFLSAFRNSFLCPIASPSSYRLNISSKKKDEKSCWAAQKIRKSTEKKMRNSFFCSVKCVFKKKKKAHRNIIIGEKMEWLSTRFSRLVRLCKKHIFFHGGRAKICRKKYPHRIFFTLDTIFFPFQKLILASSSHLVNFFTFSWYFFLTF